LETSETLDRAGARWALALAASCYLVFVVYGSLVPLDYRPRPFDAAWQAFLHTRYLALGIGSRADWVANILLYIPLAYLLTAATAGGCRSAFGRLVWVVVVFVACAAVALAVEFTQLFFPPRTVSLNDIAAEFIGSALGIGIWLTWGGALARLWAEMGRGGTTAIRAAVVAYVLAYLALGLFPYDFVVSAQEFAQKQAARGYGVFFAQGTCGRFSDCVAKVIADIVAIIPLGVLVSMIVGRSAPHAYRTAVLAGLALGLVLEIAQLFLASGVSEGMSLASRVAGMAIGVAVHRHVRLQSLARLGPYIAPALLVGVPIYVVALMWANAWFTARWLGVEAASTNLDKVRWLPFYYHYYTTETHALRSLLACIAMYLPVGLAYWLWTLRRSRVPGQGNAMVPALLAAPLAFAMEMGKLLVPGKHPDPTNVLIAMLAAMGAYVIAARMYRWALQGETALTAASPMAHSGTGTMAHSAAHSVAGSVAQSPSGSAAPVETGAHPRGILPAVLLLAGTGFALWHYPLGGAWLAIALVAYGALLWRYPCLCLPAVLALLPLLNLGAWTGWTALNEFDLLMAVTLAVRLTQPREAGASASLSPGARIAIGFLAASFFASALVGLLPLPAFDASALTSYLSGFNSVAQLKGFVWALALLPMLLEEAGDPERFDRRLTVGMLAGLCGVLAVVLWERTVFAGLLDFAGEYRAEGPFPELHTGGGDIHAYLVMAIPFVIGWIVLNPTLHRIAAGAVIFVLASYALGVTFTRGGYIGYVGAVGVLAGAVAIQWLRRGDRKIWRIATAALLVLGGIAVLVPILSGPFMESRLAGTRTEAGTRTRHWVRALDMMDSGAATTIVGMGLGSFPRTFLFRDPAAASATFGFAHEGDNGFLRLGSGRPLFVNQRMDVRAGERYTLALDVRASDPKAQVGALLCERSAQQSFRCATARIQPGTARRAWEHREAVLDVGEVGSGPWFLRRPVMLSFSNAQGGSVIDVDNVRLVDGAGRDLVANGDFSRSGARWSFSADDHLPWHIFNLWVQILFEQGWVGVLAVALAIGVSLTRLASATAKGDAFAPVLLAALCGFLLIGLTESLFDGPRVTTLFFVLLFAGMLRPATRSPR
jgi:VanZ family protein